jgi:hypothetical protein
MTQRPNSDGPLSPVRLDATMRHSSVASARHAARSAPGTNVANPVVPAPPLLPPPRSLLDFAEFSAAPQQAPPQLSARDIAAAAETPIEALRALLAAHYSQLYPHISVLGDASYAHFEDNFFLAVMESDTARRLDLPKRYSATTMWAAPADYGFATVLVEGPAGVGKSSIMKMAARGQLTNMTVDDEVRVRSIARANRRHRATPQAGLAGDSSPSGQGNINTPTPPGATPNGRTVVFASGSTSGAYASASRAASATPSQNRNGAGGAPLPSVACEWSPTPMPATSGAFEAGSGKGHGRLVVMVELRHLALQCISHGWEKITPARLLDSALRGLGGDAGGAIPPLPSRCARAAASTCSRTR